MNTLLLIDGNAIMHRAYHALPALSTKDGIPTNAVYGFFTMLHKALTDFSATHIVVTFDTPKPTFRKELHKEYQAHRPHMINEMSLQFPLVKELLDTGGIKRIEKEGYEADDVIGTLTEMYKIQDNIRVFILTGDRDIMQLVDHNVFVITPLKGVSTIAIYNQENVKEKFGIAPAQIPDLKALMGDASDNYSGAKGIGPKTAVKLLTQFGTVERLLDHTDEIKEDRIRQLVMEHIENIRLSKDLATIRRNVEIECAIQETAFHGFKSEMKDMLQKLELFSLIGRLYGSKQANPVQTIDTKKVVHKKKDDASQMDLFN